MEAVRRWTLGKLNFLYMAVKERVRVSERL